MDPYVATQERCMFKAIASSGGTCYAPAFFSVTLGSRSVLPPPASHPLRREPGRGGSRDPLRSVTSVAITDPLVYH